MAYKVKNRWSKTRTSSRSPKTVIYNKNKRARYAKKVVWRYPSGRIKVVQYFKTRSQKSPSKTFKPTR